MNDKTILMKLETERLYIKLLTLDQLKLWVNNIQILEKELDCKYDAEPIVRRIFKYNKWTNKNH
jgi:hypothetical protein